MSLTLLVIFVATLALGVPVAASLGLASAVVIVVFGLPVNVLAQRAVNALDSTPLLAVPLFILAASLLNAMGVTTHIFDLVRLIVGRIRGAVAQVSILVSLIFSGVSGAALADIGALGKIQIDQMTGQGYRKDFSAGLAEPHVATQRGTAPATELAHDPYPPPSVPGTRETRRAELRRSLMTSA